MSLILWAICGVIGSTLFLWAFWAVIVPLEKWSADKHDLVRGLVMTAFGVFWVCDVLYNLVTGTLIFWEWPNEAPETFSARLRRNYKGPKGWRQYLASLFRIHVNHVEAGHI